MSLNARSYLFDAGIISLFYAGSRVVKPYFDRVFTGAARGFISEVNLAEFYYKTAEKKGLDTAEVWYNQIRQSAFRIVAPGESITRDAALLKVGRKHLSLADCFALATRRAHAEVLLTTDSNLKKVEGKHAVHISPS